MESKLNEAFLDSALGELEKARAWSPRVISKFETLLRNQDPWTSYRVNPLRFAAEKSLAEDEALDLFLHGSRLGLFQLEWRLMCPACGDTVESFAKLNLLESSCFCAMCHLTTTANMDDLVHVSFSATPQVRAAPWHQPELLSIEDLYFRTHFDPEACLPGGVKEVDSLLQLKKGLTYVDRGATAVVEATVTAGFWAAHDLLSTRGFAIQLAGEPVTTPQVVRLELTADGWMTPPATVAPGPVRFELTNATAARASLMIINMPASYSGPGGLDFPNALTGNRLLNSQTFRSLFRTEVISSSEGIGVRDLTLLFTDLKGSTELYERIGDLKAFSLVQRHFEHLAKAVREHNGAVVKTIGDAVMASFNNPADAMRAGLAMLDEISAFNQREGSREIILKVGIHRGASIAVTLNERLDYFGQVVNTAARVQGLADAEEICFTREVHDASGVGPLLAPFGVRAELATLKGISRPLQVYRLAPRPA